MASRPSSLALPSSSPLRRRLQPATAAAAAAAAAVAPLALAVAAAAVAAAAMRALSRCGLVLGIHGVLPSRSSRAARARRRSSAPRAQPAVRARRRRRCSLSCVEARRAGPCPRAQAVLRPRRARVCSGVFALDIFGLLAAERRHLRTVTGLGPSELRRAQRNASWARRATDDDDRMCRIDQSTTRTVTGIVPGVP